MLISQICNECCCFVGRGVKSGYGVNLEVNILKRFELLVEDMFKVYALRRDSGKCDILDFFTVSDVNREELKERNNMLARLEKIAMGKKLLPAVCHRVDDDHKLWQIRTDKYRLIWFYDRSHIIICTNVFSKRKSGSTPYRHLERARKLREEYFKARESGTVEFIDDCD